jgi:SAM-dependent methyltransferase
VHSDHITMCRLCGSDLLQEILVLGNTPAGDLYKTSKLDSQTLTKYPLACNICKNCGHVQLTYFIDPSEIYSEYIYKTSDSLGLDSHFSAFSRDVFDYSNSNGMLNVFEMGCNDGTLLKYFKELGYATLGMDPAVQPIIEARKKGLNVIQSYFNHSAVAEIKNLMPQIDVIIANNVIANVKDLDSVFDGFVELLSENGFIVIETGYLKYLTDLKVIDNIHHEHIDYFAIAPLVKFFANKGLYIDRVLINESKGSSVRIFVRKGNIDKMPLAVRDLCGKEVLDKFFDPSTYLELEKNIVSEHHRLIEFITEARNKGLLVVGYGAAIGTTTLLFAFRLENEIDFLVDDNLRRIGKFAPGTGLEVKSSSAIQDQKCAVIVFAWRYKNVIKEKNKRSSKIEMFTSIWGNSE